MSEENVGGITALIAIRCGHWCAKFDVATSGARSEGSEMAVAYGVTDRAVAVGQAKLS